MESANKNVKLNIQTRCVRNGELNHLFALETAGYPADEAASMESLAYRCKNANDYFVVARENNQIVGFICGTLTESENLNHETMSTHVSTGIHLCIHSVVVDDKFRRKGIGSVMLSAYVDHVINIPQVTKISLICKKHLIGFYTKKGPFALIGPSSVVHGQDPWFECSLITKIYKLSQNSEKEIYLRELAKQAYEAESKIAFLEKQYTNLHDLLTKKSSQTSTDSDKKYSMTESQYQVLLKLRKVLVEEKKEFEQIKADEKSLRAEVKSLRAEGVALKEKNMQLENELRSLRAKK